MGNLKNKVQDDDDIINGKFNYNDVKEAILKDKEDLEETITWVIKHLSGKIGLQTAMNISVRFSAHKAKKEYEIFGNFMETK